MRAAIVQFSPVLGDVEANLAQIEESVERAASSGAELVVFPELALTGYRLRDLVPHVAVTLGPEDPVFRRLVRLSERRPFVLGLVEEGRGHLFFNSAAYFESGRLVHVHRKCYLPTYGMFDEAMDFAAGPRLRAFDTRFGRVGILVCEDAWHPAAATVLTQDGATTLWVLASSPLRGIASSSRESLLSSQSWRQLVCILARFHTVGVLCANRVGYEDGIGFAGGSFVAGPGGDVLAEAPFLEPDILVAELDPESLRSARATYPLVRDERPDLIARELERIARSRGVREE